MERYLISLIILFALCNCAPLENSVTLKSYTREHERDLYRFSYLLSDDQSRFEEGVLSENGSFSVTGFYKFRGTNGKIYVVDYISNEKVGYRATVRMLDDIPMVAPSINPNVLKTLVG